MLLFLASLRIGYEFWGGGTFGDWMEMDGEDLDVGLGWVCYASEF